MSGETRLRELLAKMAPELDPQPYVFATTQNRDRFGDLDILMRFSEREGETFILKAEDAQAANLSHSGEFARITLNVHSDLEAVGFLAAISSALAENSISANAVSAYYHDHMFVPFRQAQSAMKALEDLSSTAQFE